jgi:hypothetical protein
MSWRSWEKELHPEAAKEDAEKLFTALSELFHQAVFHHLIQPIELSEPHAESLQNPQGFLQEALSGLGLKGCIFPDILSVALQDTYRYIVSDLNKRCLDPYHQNILESYTTLLYRLYPAFGAHSSASQNPFASSKIEYSIYSSEVLSKAVSPRFTAAMRMLSIRQKAIGAVKERKKPRLELEALDEHATVSAPDLAFLAGIAYSYVTKLFREGRLPGQTRGKFIYIPVAAAIAFTASRPTAPTWVKTLASQKNIAPRGVRHTAADYLL